MSSYVHNGKEITYDICEKNIRINDSYKIKAKSGMIEILTRICADATYKGYTYTRTLKSWLREWQAHNVLYTLGVARKRTGSVDLNENASGIARFCYNLLALLYWY